MRDWNPFEENTIEPAGPESVIVEGVEVRKGGRVKLRPLGRADIFDIALNGKIATVVSIEQDFENRLYLAVTIDDDPGNDFGRTGKPGHRFFYGIDEVEPLTDARIG